MAEPTDIVLEHLRAIRADLATIGDRISRVEGRLFAVEQHVIALSIDIGNLNARMAGVEGRLDRIERRLGLVDAQ